MRQNFRLVHVPDDFEDIVWIFGDRKSLSSKLTSQYIPFTSLALAHCGNRLSLFISFWVILHINIFCWRGASEVGRESFFFPLCKYYYFINAIDFRCISTIQNRTGPAVAGKSIALIMTHKI